MQITISKKDHWNPYQLPFDKGDNIRVKSIGIKRTFVQVKEVNGNSFTGTLVFKPAPKSQLKNSSIFTKNKNKKICQ